MAEAAEGTAAVFTTAPPWFPGSQRNTEQLQVIESNSRTPQEPPSSLGDLEQVF